MTAPRFVLSAGLLLAPQAGGIPQERDPFLLVLGVAQDGGVPQAGSADRGIRRRVVSLALVDPRSSRRWLFEATPDFPDQLRTLDSVAPPGPRRPPGLAGIFLTHAHVGHYAGLLFLGHESMGAERVPVHAMPRFAAFLRSNGPWSQLAARGNILLRELAAGTPVPLDSTLSVIPFRVPHRQEYSEVVGFRIDGPHRSVLFLPDIDSWVEWDSAGTRLEDALADVEVAYLDGTFFDDGEVPGRDMSTFPHPFIRHTMARLARLPASERAKVRFIHLNHTNPALVPETAASREIRQAGFRVAEEGERIGL